MWRQRPARTATAALGAVVVTLRPLFRSFLSHRTRDSVMIRSFFVTSRHALVHFSSSFGLILLCFAATRDLRVISICLLRRQSRWRSRWAGMAGRRLRVSSQSINRASNQLSKGMEIHPAQYDTVVHSKAQAIRPRCLRCLGPH